MDSFKDIAYQILKEAGKPLHSKEITKIALRRGWLKTAGKTPEATMNAQLLKTAPSTFGLNPDIKEKVEKEKKQWTIAKGISTRQKGDIGEARIVELITLYGDTALVCYKPVSDVE